MCTTESRSKKVQSLFQYADRSRPTLYVYSQFELSSTNIPKDKEAPYLLH